jgi:hypothetical protein
MHCQLLHVCLIPHKMLGPRKAVAQLSNAVPPRAYERTFSYLCRIRPIGSHYPVVFYRLVFLCCSPPLCFLCRALVRPFSCSLAAHLRLSSFLPAPYHTPNISMKDDTFCTHLCVDGWCQLLPSKRLASTILLLPPPLTLILCCAPCVKW